MHAMVAVWLLVTLMLFVAEPLFLDRWLLARARPGRKRPSAHRAAALDLIGSEPDHFDRRRSRQPRGAAHRLSAPRAIAMPQLALKRMWLPGVLDLPRGLPNGIGVFLISEGCR